LTADKDDYVLQGVADALGSQGIKFKSESLNSPELHKAIGQYLDAIQGGKSFEEARESLNPFFVVFDLY